MLLNKAKEVLVPTKFGKLSDKISMKMVIRLYVYCYKSQNTADTKARLLLGSNITYHKLNAAGRRWFHEPEIRTQLAYLVYRSEHGISGKSERICILIKVEFVLIKALKALPMNQSWIPFVKKKNKDITIAN